MLINKKNVTEIIFAVILLTILASCTGCAGALLGIKSYETKESRTEFITGADFSFGLNGVDTVTNQRGIEPSSKPLFKKAVTN